MKVITRSQILCAAVVVSLAACPTLASPSSSDKGHLVSKLSPRIPMTPSLARTGNPPTIAPGQTRIFTVADGGSTACARLEADPIDLPPPPSTEFTCHLPRYGVGLNSNDPSANFVEVYASIVLGPGVPYSVIPAHAASAVYNDFTVGGSRNTLVDAQIGVTFDYVGNIVGTLVYRNELFLGLVIEDVTDNQPRPVGALSLFDQGRAGDQGVTDITSGVEIVPVDDASSGFIVKVRQGHTYRVWFQLDVDNFGAGLGRAQAQWSTMVVSIEQDCETVSQRRANQGCDGLDDDCDGTVDECDEDASGPTVFVDPAIRGECFATQADALAAILHATAASDDCGAVTTVPILDGFTCDVLGSAVATDDCGNATMVGGLPMRIDGERPLVTCSTVMTSLFPPDHSFTDVGFRYITTDNCSGELKVDVKVTSDEQTTLPPGTGNASPFPDAVVLRTIDGTLAGVLLRNERGGGGDGRVYNIHIFATDQCGNTGHAACAVSVPQNRNGRVVDNGQYFDATGIN